MKVWEELNGPLPTELVTLPRPVSGPPHGAGRD